MRYQNGWWRIEGSTSKEDIKSLLELERWSKRAQRVFELVKKYASEGDYVSIEKTTDFYWDKRKNRPHDWHIFLVGADKYGRRYTYYVYLVIKNKEV